MARVSLAFDRRKKHKYGATRTTVDTITFASKAEARRYQELKLLEKAGEIDSLVLQPRFDLHANRVKLGTYVADFSYWDKVNTAKPVQVIEDVKGFDVPLGRWKRKHAEAQYGIEIKVIK